MTQDSNRTPIQPAEEDRREFREEADSLWRLTLAPVTWAGHFLTSYVTIAVICAKNPAALPVSRFALVLFTLAALAMIAWLGWKSWRQWDVRGTGKSIHARGQAEDRHRFLGHAAVLLSIISAIGVLYDSLPILVLGDVSMTRPAAISAYFLAIAVWIAPLETWLGSVFPAHMLRHMMLVAIIPPLFVLGAPAMADRLALPP